MVVIEAPRDGDAIAPTEGSGNVEVIATVTDLESQVLDVRLELEGAASFADVAYAPPWTWPLTLPEGEWTARVIAVDWGGNEGRAEVTFAIGAVEAESSGGVDEVEGDGGCGCRGREGVPWWIVAIVLVRRRALAVALAVGGCAREDGDDTGADGEESTTSTSTSTTTSTMTSTSTGEDDAECPVGTLECPCTEALGCEVELACVLQTCEPCPSGSFGCACDRAGACDRGLVCAHGQCAAFIPCGFPDNGECDEPEGTGLCLDGSDPGDCGA
jgi:hypothetical protein